MEAEAQTLTGRLRPFWGRIMVIPSDHDSEETSSGIILPFVGDYSPVRRGVVAHVDRATIEHAESIDDLVPGTVVYFIGGLKVLDSIMLMRQEIVAYEAGRIVGNNPISPRRLPTQPDSRLWDDGYVDEMLDRMRHRFSILPYRRRRAYAACLKIIEWREADLARRDPPEPEPERDPTFDEVQERLRAAMREPLTSGPAGRIVPIMAPMAPTHSMMATASIPWTAAAVPDDPTEPVTLYDANGNERTVYRHRLPQT